jgi:hypothetical protein
MRQPTIHQMREKKNHGGKVKEVEKLQYCSETVPCDRDDVVNYRIFSC